MTKLHKDEIEKIKQIKIKKARELIQKCRADMDIDDTEKVVDTLEEMTDLVEDLSNK